MALRLRDRFTAAFRHCPTQRVVGAAIVAAAAIRLAAALALPHSMLNDPTADPDAYVRIAHNWAATGVYARVQGVPTAYRPPGYIALIAPFCAGEAPWVWGIQAVHLVAAGVTVWATARLARLWVGRGEWLAAWLVAIDPILINQSALVMTETFFAAVLTLAALSWTEAARAPRPKWRALWPGILIFTAAMTRPIMWPIWAAWGVTAWTHSGGRMYVRISLIAMLLTLPWVARNAYMLGRPIVTTTHGAYTLWLGQNPSYYHLVVAPDTDAGPRLEDYQRYVDHVSRRLFVGVSETMAEYLCSLESWKWISQRPLAAAHTAAYHVATFWRAMPRLGPDWQRYLVGGYYILLNVFMLIGIFDRESWRWPRLMAVLALLASTVVHAIYWSDMRMRGPFAPIIACLAVVGAMRIRDLMRRLGAKRAGNLRD